MKIHRNWAIQMFTFINKSLCIVCFLLSKSYISGSYWLYLMGQLKRDRKCGKTYSNKLSPELNQWQRPWWRQPDDMWCKAQGQQQPKYFHHFQLNVGLGVICRPLNSVFINMTHIVPWLFTIQVVKALNKVWRRLQISLKRSQTVITPAVLCFCRRELLF